MFPTLPRALVFFVVRGGGGDGCVGDADADNGVVGDVCYAGSIEM